MSNEPKESDRQDGGALVPPRLMPNGVDVAGTAWTLQLTLKDVIVVNGKQMEAPIALVGIPWSMAKALVHMMAKTIETYERSQGQVSVPANVVKYLEILERNGAVEEALGGLAQSPEPPENAEG